MLLLLLPALVSGQNLIQNNGFEEAEERDGVWLPKNWYVILPQNLWNESQPYLLTNPYVDTRRVLVRYIDYTKNLIYTPDNPNFRRLNIDVSDLAVFRDKTKILPAAGAGAMNTIIGKNIYQTELKKPLSGGIYYYFSFSIRCTGYIPEDSKVGAMFTHSDYRLFPGKLHERNNRIRPHIVVNDSLLREANEWLKVDFVFKAESDYEYMLFGNYCSGKDNFTPFMIDDFVLMSLENYFATDTFDAGSNLNFPSIMFEFSQSVLQKEDIESLKILAEFLKEETDVSIHIVGHTDSIGFEKDNIKLSKERAQAVADLLKAHGVPDNRISFSFVGSTHPYSTNKTSAGRAANRRVEIKLTKRNLSYDTDCNRKK